MKIVPPGPEGKLVGYVRVSREEQSVKVQREALIAAGVLEANIYEDSKSGRTMRRLGVQTANKALRDGDALVVWKLDRLTRSARDLATIIDDFRERNVALYSLTEGMDVTTPGGRAMAMVSGVMAEYEVEVMSLRTKAGQALGRELGYHPGRPSMTTPEQKAEIIKLIANKPKNITMRKWRERVAKRFKIADGTVANIVKNARRDLTKTRRGG
jgi:DNA invertase Pin-like site-specific DNA recombinase